MRDTFTQIAELARRSAARTQPALPDLGHAIAAAAAAHTTARAGPWRSPLPRNAAKCSAAKPWRFRLPISRIAPLQAIRAGRDDLAVAASETIAALPHRDRSLAKGVVAFCRGGGTGPHRGERPAPPAARNSIAAAGSPPSATRWEAWRRARPPTRSRRRNRRWRESMSTTPTPAPCARRWPAGRAPDGAAGIRGLWRAARDPLPRMCWRGCAPRRAGSDR